eukprot:6465623-Amphidinium_carterae.1
MNNQKLQKIQSLQTNNNTEVTVGSNHHGPMAVLGILSLKEWQHQIRPDYGRLSQGHEYKVPDNITLLHIQKQMGTCFDKVGLGDCLILLRSTPEASGLGCGKGVGTAAR